MDVDPGGPVPVIVAVGCCNQKVFRDSQTGPEVAECSEGMPGLQEALHKEPRLLVPHHQEIHFDPLLVLDVVEVDGKAERGSSQ